MMERERENYGENVIRDQVTPLAIVILIYGDRETYSFRWKRKSLKLKRIPIV